MVEGFFFFFFLISMVEGFIECVRMHYPRKVEVQLG